MSKKCHITLIKSIRLESVKFILPKRLSSPKIVHTICLINEGNFPITYTMMFVIFKMSVKWRLFDGIPFNKIPMGWLVIVKSRSKTFSTPCVLFRAYFAWKKNTTLLERQFQLLGSIQYSIYNGFKSYSGQLSIATSKNYSVVNTICISSYR